MVEVTSPSLYTHDHQTKLELYGAVPSIQGYLILDQERVFADWYTRAAEGWQLRQYSDSAASILLEPLDIDLPMSQVYSRVQLPTDTRFRGYSGRLAFESAPKLQSKQTSTDLRSAADEPSPAYTPPAPSTNQFASPWTKRWIPSSTARWMMKSA